MSGGSFDYVCFKVEGHEVLSTIDQLTDMESYLRGIGKDNAADEVYAFRLHVETCLRQLSIYGSRITHLLYAAEWCASGDHGPEGIDTALAEMIAKDMPTKAIQQMTAGETVNP